MATVTPGSAGPGASDHGWLLRVIAVLVVVLLLGGGAVAAWWYLVRVPPTSSTASAPCGSAGTPGTATPSRARFLPGKPLPPEKVKVTVYNSTQRNGLAAAVTNELVRRGFKVGKPANDPLDKTIAAPAEIRFGRAGARAALSVRAQLKGAVPVIDRRKSASVNLVLGQGYKGLRSPAEAVAAATTLPKPRRTPTPGC